MLYFHAILLQNALIDIAKYCGAKFEGAKCWGTKCWGAK